MASLDVDAMLERFRERAKAVKQRPLPPVAGEERQQFLAQANVDFQDFAIIGDATGAIEDGVLVLRVDLTGGGVRPADPGRSELSVRPPLAGNLGDRRGRGSAGRASPCQGEGRGFESRRPLQEMPI